MSEAIVMIWIICGLVGAVVGQSKGRALAGFVLGLLLGLIGVLITALLSKTPEKKAEELDAMRQALAVAAPPTQGQWWPDPRGRHQLRYWDGARWTDYVSDDQQQSIDVVRR